MAISRRTRRKGLIYFSCFTLLMTWFLWTVLPYTALGRALCIALVLLASIAVTYIPGCRIPLREKTEAGRRKNAWGAMVGVGVASALSQLVDSSNGGQVWIGLCGVVLGGMLLGSNIFAELTD